jgi:arylsulfatase A
MKAKMLAVVLVLFAAQPGLCVASAQVETDAPFDRPNIVIILADDLGIGDLGVYNADSKIATPNCDQLAAQGIRFTDAHSPSSVCSPTRYGLLTGRYCWRSRLKSWVLNGNSRLLIEPGRPTIASMLNDAGYSTACIGKWHLGLGSYDPEAPGAKTDYSVRLDAGPATVGFRESFIIPASLDMPPYIYVVGDHPLEAATDTTPGSQRRWAGGGGYWRAGKIAPGFDFEGALPRIADESVAFINRQSAAKSDNPFFLYVPLPAPHTPWMPTKEFQGVSDAGWYGDFVAQVDAVVGQIVAALERNGQMDKTLVIVTSDNGSHWRPRDIEQFGHRANGPYRGMKADVHEGGHRVPLIVRLPGDASSDTVRPVLVGLNDMYATIAELIGHTLADDEAPDSVSFWWALTGEDSTNIGRTQLVHHSADGMFAIRAGDWKLIDGLGSGGFTQPRRVKAEEDGAKGQLFNLALDPAEKSDVYMDHPDIVDQLTKKLRAVQVRSGSENARTDPGR